jgi:hypothetical protein
MCHKPVRHHVMVEELVGKRASQLIFLLTNL